MTEDQKVKLLTLLSSVEDVLIDCFDPDLYLLEPIFDELKPIFEELNILRAAIEEVADGKPVPKHAYGPNGYRDVCNICGNIRLAREQGFPSDSDA